MVILKKIFGIDNYIASNNMLGSNDEKTIFSFLLYNLVWFYGVIHGCGPPGFGQ